jgi:hypothetical protein
MARIAWFITACAAGTVVTSIANPSIANAGEPPRSCAPRAEIVQYLAAESKEQPVAVGAASHGTRLEVFASPNGSWTLLVTLTNGMSCLMNAGTDWQVVPRVAAVTE